MNKKQYNNVIDWTLKHEAEAQSEDSLEATRAICKNLGVALPGGTMKEVADTLATNDYMYWHSCTMQEAQEAADNGTAAIGVSEERIVLLAATDEEQPVADTASVMTLDENTSAYAMDGMRYYVYGYGTTTGGTTVVIPEEPEVRVFNNNYLICQWDENILYPNGEQPGSEERAFYDEAFYTNRNVCNKTGDVTGTIRKNGCGICSLAMYLLYKSNQINTNNNTYYAVKTATIQGTNDDVNMHNGSFTISYGGVTANVSPVDKSVTMAKLDAAINAGKMCVVRIKTDHYVLIYGIDSGATGTDKYLVADPGNNNYFTLTESMRKYGYSGNISNLSSMRIIE